MTDPEFDVALITSAFALAAREGWAKVSVIGAARAGALPLEQARLRFSGPNAILLRFGQHADALALAEAADTGPTRERLFDLLMRRFDALQTQRAGVLALLHGLPTDPATALLLGSATAKSMGWMLEAAGVPTTGLSGFLATKGLVAVWLYALNAWQRDDSLDLSTTMAALDRALSRAEQAANWFVRPTAAVDSGPKPFPEPVVDADFNETGTISGRRGHAARRGERVKKPSRSGHAPQSARILPTHRRYGRYKTLQQESSMPNPNFPNSIPPPRAPSSPK